MTTDLITVADASIDEAEVEAVAAVLRTRWLSAGPVTAAFEAEFAEAIGAQGAVAVSSGTAALHLALVALGIGPGDEVIVPSLSFVAGAAMVAGLGGRPVFCDIRSPDDLTLDPADVARVLTDRTRAIMPMHYGGYPADLPALKEIADRHGVALVEDAAHAVRVAHPLGALGTVGDVGCFSFFATKNLTCGEGGMVVAPDTDLLDRVRMLRSHHSTTATWARHVSGVMQYDVTGIGFNYRPTEISSAIGRVQLGKLAYDRAHRAKVVGRYWSALADVPGLGLPFASSTHDTGYHLFPIVLPQVYPRATFVTRLREAGIQTSVHYRPTHLLSYYRDNYPAGRALPVVESIADRLVSLPLHARLTDAEVDRVIEAVVQLVADHG